MDSATMDRAAGVLLAQACGDALGVPYEFRTGPFPEVEMIGGGLGPYAPGEYSDDTQMAVCIAQVAATGADLTSVAALDQIAAKFEKWVSSGATDVGSQTRAVLADAARRQGSPSARLRAASEALHARTGRTAGNGALMRTASVGISRLNDRVQTASAARAVAELTHADPLAGDSCVIWCELIRAAVLGHPLDAALTLDLIPEERRGAWSIWLTDAASAETSAAFRNNGYTVTALQAALWAITHTPQPVLDPAASSYPCQHLQDALRTAVNIGGDTDTVSAIAGGLLGARWGVSAIPNQWHKIVHGWPGLRSRDLVALAVLTVRGGQDDSAGWRSGPNGRSSMDSPGQGDQGPD